MKNLKEQFAENNNHLIISDNDNQLEIFDNKRDEKISVRFNGSILAHGSWNIAEKKFIELKSKHGL